MTSTDTRILFVGDMHLGTRPARLPAAVGDPDALGPAGAWHRAVDAALDRGVQAVALAGDVVNRRNALFEAAAALRPGLEKLQAAGVTVLAVAGNHDTRALPALLRGGAPLRLLGRNGRWDEHVVGGGGRPAVRVVGWSFPRERWESSPLAEPPPTARADLPTFGLLHADLDAVGSIYAPVSAAALAAVGYDGWFLGHIHTPGRVPDDGRPVYLGSLVGLDPTETGEHGPVLVTVRPDGGIRRERLALAPLRWERWEIPCTDAPHGADDLQELLLRELEPRAVALGLEPGAVLGVRAVLVGTSGRPVAAARSAAALDLQPVTFAGVTVFVERVTTELRVPADLEDLARADDPPGLLARRIMVLEHGPRVAGDDELLADLLARLREADGDAQALPGGAGDGPVPDEALRRRGAAAARRLLDRLLEARGGAP